MLTQFSFALDETHVHWSREWKHSIENESAHDTKFFIILFERAFQNDEEWRLFYSDSAELFKILIYAD